MRYRPHALLLLLIALTPSRTLASESGIVDIPPGDDVIVPITKGSISPITGQVFESATSLRWANWLQQYRFQLKQSELYGQEKLRSSEALSFTSSTL